jgi:hypothetical protein
MTFSICQLALLESGRESNWLGKNKNTDPVTIGGCLVVLSKENNLFMDYKCVSSPYL